METKKEGELLTFREIKKRMTEERVLKNKLEGRTEKIRARYEGVEPGGQSSDNSSDWQEEVESGLEEGDLFLIIRSNNKKEMLVDGSFVTNPDALNSNLKKTDSSSSTSAPSLCYVPEGQDSRTLKLNVGLQAGAGLFDPQSLLPSTSKGLKGKTIADARLKAGCSKCSEVKTESPCREKSSDRESASDETNVSASSSSNKSSEYSDSKDELKKTILEHGEVGPKRLLLDPRKAQPKPPSKPTSIPKEKPQPNLPLMPNGKNLRPLGLQPSSFLSPSQRTQLTTNLSPNVKKAKAKNFITYVNNKNYVTKGSKKANNSKFQYHLSEEESRFFTTAKKTAMKDVPEKEKKILKDGQRRQYLDVRNSQGPVSKYHYPEATSWRYGWVVDKTKTPRS